MVSLFGCSAEDARMLRSLTAILFAIPLAFAVAGCTPAGSPPITGKVTLDGSPLTHADVEFEKRDKEGVAKFAAKTDAEGKFKVPSVPGRTIAPGTYQVLVTKWVDAKGKETDPENVEMLKASGNAKNIVPAKYSDPAFSPLKAEIKSGANELQPFDIKTK
jgi:hypothetical protein